ncbi:SDR family oxidoreductase [Candidatus Riflebacteria bacterium]
MKLKGKRVLITGASSGIGKALALAFAASGAKLVLASRKVESLERVAKKVKNKFPRFMKPLVVPCDVSSAREVQNLVAACISSLDGIDILVNNAGICVYGAAARTELDDYQKIMRVNYFGTLNCMLAAIPQMQRIANTLIVNITSVAAIHGVPYLAAYCASKSAIVALSQSLRAELAPGGPRIMLVYPGYTETDIFVNEKRVGGAKRPEGPYATASEVATAIIRAIKKEKLDLIFTAEGKALSLLQGFSPWLVRKAMEKIAFDLKE